MKIRIPKPVEKPVEPRRKFRMELSSANRKKLDEERRTRAKIEAKDVGQAIFYHMEERLQNRFFELVSILKSAGIRDDDRAERTVVKGFIAGMIEAAEKKFLEYRKSAK